MSDVERPWVERRRSGPPSSCPVCGGSTTLIPGTAVVTCLPVGVGHFEWFPGAEPVVSVSSECADDESADWARHRGSCRMFYAERRCTCGADNRRYDKPLTTEPLPESDPAAIAPLTADEVAELPEGAKVTVIWSGGNGPHDYVIAVNNSGTRCAWNGVDERLRFYNPLRFVGQERFHTRVWLRDAPPATAPDVHVPGCPALNRSGDCTCAPLEGELMGRDFVETAERRLHPDAAELASLHRPVYGRPPYCWACTSPGPQQRINSSRRVAWPCRTASLALEMMGLTASDIAITEE